MNDIFFEVLRSGINTTYQDKGRFHMQHLGVTPSGCMDLESFLIEIKTLIMLYNVIKIEHTIRKILFVIF